MNHDAAVNLINQTFDTTFDEGQFERLAANILNQVNRDRGFGLRSGNIIPQAFRNHISTYRRPFVYYDPEGERMDVLIVRLHRESSLERARTMQRNFIAHYLKQDHNEPVEAVLAAFYHEEVADWRFSLVRLEYAFGDEGGVEEKLTPARRYSFLVGPTEPTHTAVQQLLPFLLNDAANPTLAQLARAFQVEVVSKQFFEAYKELFLKLREALEKALAADKQVAADFQRAGIDLPNFAKKLLGQIVFLYFVQKKGWLGVAPEQPWGAGPRDFLRRLCDRRDGFSYDSFFNDVLEPLFYDALAIQRPDDLFRFGGHAVKIPFLNGGLFEPMGGYDWRHTHLALPNSLFSNRRDERDDQGTGILDVLDRYNFTVWEEEPLEKEVAVDPEMLGKVFENMLEVQDRKSKGAFYTPREIVYYMCQESLIHYLDTALNMVEASLAPEKPTQGILFGDPPPKQQALTAWQRQERVPREEIAALVRLGALALQQDAAKEAGLQKGDYVLPQSVRQHAAALDAALAAIKLCDPAIGSGAFPVGMLHEIVQARLALDTQLKAGRTPYALKRHAIQQSIYGVDIDGGAIEIAKLRLWLSLVVDEESYADIQPLPNLDYKIVRGNSLVGMGVARDLLNQDLFTRLDDLKEHYFSEDHPQEKIKLKARIDQLMDQIAGAKRDFDFGIYFHEVFKERGGFDAVIGNPPYVRQEQLAAFKPIFKQRFPEVYAGTADLYTYFYAQGLTILRERATLAFITSNKFMRAGYGRNLRIHLGATTRLHAIIDFGDLPVFDATAYPCIVIVQKEAPQPENALLALTVDSLDVLQNLPLVVDDLAWELQQQSLRAEGWALVRPEVQALMTKLRRQRTPLSEFVGGKFHRGILTGLNQAFVIDEATRQRLIAADPRSAEVIKPWLRGRDIKRWRVEWDRQYAIIIQNSGDADADNPWADAADELAARQIFRETYPAVHDHLSQYEEALRKRQDQGRFWWELRACAYYKEFGKPKIVYQEIATFHAFAWAANNFLLNNKCFFIPTDTKYLLGLLNANATWFFLRNIASALQGGALAMQSPYVGAIPIPSPTDEQRIAIERLVEKVIDAHGEEFKIAAWEQELNEIVYRLYGLTAAEIALIEAETGRSG